MIQKLKPTSFGNTSLPVSILKKSSVQLVSLLTALINESFITGIFPDCSKCADVTPINKGASNEDVSNYRPISVLPLFRKIFETGILNWLVKFCDKYSILSPQQCVFQCDKGL